MLHHSAPMIWLSQLPLTKSGTAAVLQCVAVRYSALQFVAACCNMLWFAYPHFCQPTESSTTAVSVTVRVAQSSVGPWETTKNRNRPWVSCCVLDVVVAALVVCFQRVKHLYLIRLFWQHSSLLIWNFRICLRDYITYSTSLFVSFLTWTTHQGAWARQAKNYKKFSEQGFSSCRQRGWGG